MQSRQFVTPGRTIGQDTFSYVIAEIGNNHQGSVETCIEMLKAAKAAGADAAKLQKRNNYEIFTKDAYNAVYNSENAFADTYGAHRDFLEFDECEYKDLFVASEDIGITLFATAFDISSADFLEKIGCPMYKIASGDLRSAPLIEHVANFGKPMIISTGGANFDLVEKVYQNVMAINNNVCFLQCTAAYPCEPEDMNLGVIPEYMRRLPKAVIGLSSHDNGICLPIVAQTLGARVFEKHFTLNRTWKGTDHAFSLTPDAIRKLVRDLGRAKVSIGDGEKIGLPVEEQAIKKMGKKIVLAKDITAGTVITEALLAYKSPGDGLFPDQLGQVIGRSVKTNMKKDQSLSMELLE
ncbi:N-acetylneuraminate synthase family protein [Alphaproteobacteria bacterium]|nr:N-acetylneuraminate synthase family protein [Alphaproteobacteria bacterium]